MERRAEALGLPADVGMGLPLLHGPHFAARTRRA
jgi:hypothetical protein